MIILCVVVVFFMHFTRPKSEFVMLSTLLLGPIVSG